MTTYIIRRALWVLPVLWAVATITFFLMHMVPGGPFTQDKKLPPAVTAALERRYHFDEPLWKQYTAFLWNSSHGDLGLSVRGDYAVTDIIRRTAFVTAQLGVLGFILAVTVGMSLGTLSALNHNGLLDYIGVGFATIFASVPAFILAAFLVVLFAVNWQIFDVLGWGGPIRVGDIFDPSVYHWRKAVLPVVALSALPAAYIARVTRASVLEVLNQDYIRTARAKGLRESRVVLRHTIKNALIPVLTVMGPIAANLVAGSFIIETMFGIPGVGRESIDAVVRRDYQVIMGTTLFYTFIVTMANFAVDLAYAVVDPRIRYS
jgi:oligopeptide transport system permease protein